MGWPPRQTSLQMEHRVAQMSWLGAMLCVQQLLVASYTEASWSNNVVIFWQNHLKILKCVLVVPYDDGGMNTYPSCGFSNLS